MADVVSSQTLYDDELKAVMKFTNLSDGTGEAAVTKVDVSALNPAPKGNKVSIEKIQYLIDGMTVTMLWDADTDVKILDLGAISGPISGTLEFKDDVRLTNNAGAGRTGDILFTTTGHSVNDSYSIILTLRKS